MAEFVEFNLEEMLPELEHLVRLRIFNEAEMRNVIKTRKNYHYKIQKKKKQLEDYVRYIHYEMDLLTLVKTRRSKLCLTQKKNDIDMAIANRINKLFERAIFIFYDDIHLWLSYMKFCKQVKVFTGCVSNMLVGMLAVHSRKQSLWKLAATWEFEENKSIESACQFLKRGLRHHPNSKMLYTEAFRLELIYAEMKRKKSESKDAEDIQEEKQVGPSAASVPAQADSLEADEDDDSARHSDDSAQGHSSQGNALQWQDSDQSHSSAKNDDLSDPVIDCSCPEAIYETASKKIPDVSFLISLLNIAKDFSFTEKMQANMVKDLLISFPNDELTWDALARRELAGLHFLMDRPSEYRESFDIGEEDEKSGLSAITEVEKVQYMRIRHCFTIYERGLEHVGTERMWSLYLDTLIELNEDQTVLKNCKRKLLLSAFQKAHEEGRLQEKYYMHWANMYDNQRDDLSFVLESATERFSCSVELWQMRLRFHLSEGEEDVAMEVFKLATSLLDCEDASTLPLWKMLIQYWQTKSVKKVKEVFQDGIKQGPAVSSVLKQMYLEWLVLTKGINIARQVYQTMCIQPPFCRELHQKMAELECLQPDVQLPRVIKCYELACKQFGKNSTEVWMEYVKFERKRGDPKKVEELYLRALKTLDGELAHNFISEFCNHWVVKNLGD